MKLVAKTLLVVASITISQLALAFVDVAYSESTSKWGIGFGASEQDAAESSLKVCNQRSGSNDCIVVRKYNRPGYGAIVKTCNGHPCNHTIEGNYANAKDAREYTSYLCRKRHPSSSCDIAEEWSDGLGLNAYERQNVTALSTAGSTSGSPQAKLSVVGQTAGLKEAYDCKSAEACAPSLPVLRKAAEDGDMRAQFALGRIFLLGFGVNRDQEQSYRWYRQSAEHGFDQAQASTGMMLLEGIGVAKDDAEGFRWLRRAADQGYTMIFARLGQEYETRGNFAESLVWYRKAVESGTDEKDAAMIKIGKAYQFGRGVAQDIQQANVWYRKAATNGNAEAQARLGSYLSISERKKDIEEGITWMDKALKNTSNDHKPAEFWHQIREVRNLAFKRMQGYEAVEVLERLEKIQSKAKP